MDSNPPKYELNRTQLLRPPAIACVGAAVALLLSTPYATELHAQARYGSPPEARGSGRYGGPVTPTGPAPHASQPQPLNGGRILARIDGQLVLAADVNWQVQEQIKAVEEQRGQSVPPEQLAEATKMLTKRYVMGLVHTKLLYADFRRTVPAENLPLIEKRLAEPFEENRVPQLVKALGVDDRAALDAKLRSYGSSLKDLQRQFFESAISMSWLEERLPEPKEITHEQLLAYYEDHLADYEYPAQATYEEVMSRFDEFGRDRDATWRAACKMGNEVWRRVVANPGVRGPVFADVAKNHPDSHGFTADAGGIHEEITIGSLRCEAINEALANLELGQFSYVIESEVGFHIIRVLKRPPAGRTSFEEAQSEIRETLQKQQMQELQAAEIEKLLERASVWTAFDGDLRGARLRKVLAETLRR